MICTKNITRGIAGFTLIELITVMVILGSLFVVVLPRFQTFSPVPKTGGTAQLQSLIQEVRDRSRQERIPLMLELDTVTGEVRVMSWDRALPGTDTDQEKPGPVLKLDQEVTLETVYLVDNQPFRGDTAGIRFTRDGYADPAFIHLWEADQPFTLVVEPFVMAVVKKKGHLTCEDRG